VLKRFRGLVLELVREDLAAGPTPTFAPGAPALDPRRSSSPAASFSCSPGGSTAARRSRRRAPGIEAQASRFAAAVLCAARR
jgi:hypothetical protein